MSTFQILTLPLLAVMILATAVAIARRRLAVRFGTFWLVLWLAAAGAIIDPDFLSHAAHLLGIGRGADLVLYLSILGFFIAFFAVYLRFRRVDEQLTQVIRHLAIRDAESEATRPDPR